MKRNLVSLRQKSNSTIGSVGGGGGNSSKQSNNKNDENPYQLARSNAATGSKTSLGHSMQTSGKSSVKTSRPTSSHRKFKQ